MTVHRHPPRAPLFVAALAWALAATAQAAPSAVPQAAVMPPAAGQQGPPAQGATLDATLNAPSAGRYSVAGFFANGPRYGTVQVTLDGKPLGTPVDGYAPVFTLGDRVELGTADLQAGANALVLRVTGKHQLSQGYYVGLDRIVLTPVVTLAPKTIQPAPAPGLRIRK